MGQNLLPFDSSLKETFVSILFSNDGSYRVWKGAAWFVVTMLVALLTFTCIH